MITGIKSNLVLHKNILINKKFLDGSYTTQFLDKELAGTEQKELFMFVDEEVFVIAAAIEAYNESKSRDVSDMNVTSQWKRTGRVKGLRG